MRIAFVAGCLEPGRDGVGDYTRMLADACRRRGHAVRLLALADRVSKHESDSVLRLTALEWRRDGDGARRWLEEFAPDWTSLQFVPYSFEPRGCFGASVDALVHVLGVAARRHIFVHEIWIGSHAGAAWKARLIGRWQRIATIRLLRQVGPRVVHTNTRYHVEALATVGRAARLLPLFGSVPVRTDIEPARFPGVAEETLVCGLFGTLHEGWQAEEFLGAFAALARQLHRPAALIASGGLGVGGAERFARLAAQVRGEIECCALGRLSEAELASVFARFDFGVTTVPWNIVGKSSAAAALREHGLQVVVTAAGSPLRNAAARPVQADDDMPGFVPFFRDRALLATAVERGSPGPGVGTIAQQFLEDLDVDV